MHGAASEQLDRDSPCSISLSDADSQDQTVVIHQRSPDVAEASNFAGHAGQNLNESVAKAASSPAPSPEPSSSGASTRKSCLRLAKRVWDPMRCLLCHLLGLGWCPLLGDFVEEAVHSTFTLCFASILYMLAMHYWYHFPTGNCASLVNATAALPPPCVEHLERFASLVGRNFTGGHTQTTLGPPAGALTHLATMPQYQLISAFTILASVVANIRQYSILWTLFVLPVAWSLSWYFFNDTVTCARNVEVSCPDPIPPPDPFPALVNDTFPALVNATDHVRPANHTNHTHILGELWGACQDAKKSQCEVTRENFAFTLPVSLGLGILFTLLALALCTPLAPRRLRRAVSSRAAALQTRSHSFCRYAGAKVRQLCCHRHKSEHTEQQSQAHVQVKATDREPQDEEHKRVATGKPATESATSLAEQPAGGAVASTGAMARPALLSTQASSRAKRPSPVANVDVAPSSKADAVEMYVLRTELAAESTACSNLVPAMTSFPSPASASAVSLPVSSFSDNILASPSHGSHIPKQHTLAEENPDRSQGRDRMIEAWEAQNGDREPPGEAKETERNVAGTLQTERDPFFHYPARMLVGASSSALILTLAVLRAYIPWLLLGPSPSVKLLVGSMLSWMDEQIGKRVSEDQLEKDTNLFVLIWQVPLPLAYLFGLMGIRASMRCFKEEVMIPDGDIHYYPPTDASASFLPLRQDTDVAGANGTSPPAAHELQRPSPLALQARSVPAPADRTLSSAPFPPSLSSFPSSFQRGESSLSPLAETSVASTFSAVDRPGASSRQLLRPASTPAAGGDADWPGPMPRSNAQSRAPRLGEPKMLSPSNVKTLQRRASSIYASGSLSYAPSITGTWVISTLTAVFVARFAMALFLELLFHPTVRSWLLLYWKNIVMITIPTLYEYGLRHLLLSMTLIGKQYSQPFFVRRLRALKIWDYLFFLNSSLSGIGVLSYRLGMGLLFILVTLFRVDIPMYAPPFHAWDSGINYYESQKVTYDHQVILTRMAQREPTDCEALKSRCATLGCVTLTDSVENCRPQSDDHLETSIDTNIMEETLLKARQAMREMQGRIAQLERDLEQKALASAPSSPK